jgi:Protein of unknown function (DUF2281)
MNTEIEHLKYQLITWIVMLNDTNLLMELSKILQNAVQNPSEQPKKVRQFGSMKGLVVYMSEDFNESLDEFKEYAP